MKRQLVRALSLSVLLTELIACSQKIDPEIHFCCGFCYLRTVSTLPKGTRSSELLLLILAKQNQ